MRTVVLIPYRPTSERRHRLLEHVEQRWKAAGFEVVIGFEDDPSGPFNRSAAINEAARVAGDWDVAIIADGDTIVPPHQATAAVDLAADTGRMVMAFTQFVPLDQKMSNKILDGFAGFWGPPTGFDWTCSSAVVVRRDLFDCVGGFDEGFTGWGFEDVAFALACDAVAGPRLRVDGPVWHLWHEPSPENDENHPVLIANKARAQHYIDARDGATDSDDHRYRMLAVLRDLDVLPPADGGEPSGDVSPVADVDVSSAPAEPTRDELLAEATRLGIVFTPRAKTATIKKLIAGRSGQ